MTTVLAEACIRQRTGQISTLLLKFTLNKDRRLKCQDETSVW